MAIQLIEFSLLVKETKFWFVVQMTAIVVGLKCFIF